MDVVQIPFRSTGYFSDLICDYLVKSKHLRPFYNRFPTLEEFKGQMDEKRGNFSQEHRKVLHKVLLSQNAGVAVSGKTREHIELLKNDESYTVVTGHQLNIFTGPLYFLYKIVTTINLCTELGKAYPEQQFIPVFWMATEDHDLEEINHFYFRGKKLQWTRNPGGAVGKMDTKGLGNMFHLLEMELGKGENAEVLKNMFSNAYLQHDNFASATRYLVNEMFGGYGLVILDGDDKDLKRLMLPYMKKDIFDQLTHLEAGKTAETLQQLPGNYKIQVQPREISYFYLSEDSRERIVESEGIYFVLNTEKEFSKEALLEELEAHPERFSPNVMSRPVYQEVILPNLAYVGGGGEIAYWLEMKSVFNAMGICFPILVLRNSALLLSGKQKRKMAQLNISEADLFLPQSSLINKKIREISNIEIDFTPQKEMLDKQFQDLYDLASLTDASFLGAVRAQEVRQKNGLDKLEKRLLKAQRRKLKDQVVRIASLQNALFPDKSLQERQLNFSEMYLELGTELIPKLITAMPPLGTEFLVLEY